jgi:hypothetical protein
MERHWFVARGKQKLGPFSTDQLMQMASDGQLQPQEMVLREGEPRWMEAAAVEGLFDEVVEPVTPPVEQEPKPRPPARPPDTSRPFWLNSPMLVSVGVCVLTMVIVLVLVLSGGRSTNDSTANGGKPAGDKKGKETTSSGLNLSYISADFSAAVVLHPQRMLKTPLVAALAKEASFFGLGQDAPFDPHKLEQVIVVIEPLSESASPDPKLTKEDLTDRWKEYRSDKGRFAARFPASPKVTSMKIPEGLEGSSVVEQEGSRFEVAYRDLDQLIAADPKFFFDKAIEPFALKSKSKKDIKLDGHPGIELEGEMVEGPAGKALALRCYMVKERFYIVTAIAPKKAAAQARDFVASFKLLDKRGTKKDPDETRKDKADPKGEKYVVRKAVRHDAAAQKKTRAQLEAWLKANNSFGPDDRMVGDLLKDFDKDIRDGRAFILKLGTGLVKSKQQTWLTGRGGSFASFPLSGEQVKEKLAEKGSLFNRTATQPELLGLQPEVELSAPKIDKAEKLDGDQPVTGSVAYKRLKAEKGNFVLRFTYLVKDSVISAYHPLGTEIPAAQGKFIFSADSINLPDKKFTGPVIVFIEVCTYADPLKGETGVVVSNPVILLVHVAATPPKEKEEEIAYRTEEQDSPPEPANGAMPFRAGFILRFAEVVDGKQVLSKVLAGAQSTTFQGKSYLKSMSRKVDGVPLAGHVADERTLLLAPEPMLRKMLAAKDVKSPLIERLRKIDGKDDATLVLVMEPLRTLLAPFAATVKGSLPPELTGLTTLPDRLTSATVLLNLSGDPLLKINLEGTSEESAGEIDKLVFSSMRWVLKVYPELRDDLAPRVPAELFQQFFAVADQLYGGVEVVKQGRHVVLSLKRPEGFGGELDRDLIASSGFNDAKGMNSNPLPNSPFALGVKNCPCGVGEPGWAGPWGAAPTIEYQKAEVAEGDGAAHVVGTTNFSRQLAQAQTGRFQVEQYLRVPAGSSVGTYVWQTEKKEFGTGPSWSVKDGKFWVLDGDEFGGGKTLDTGFACAADKWYKVTVRVDVPRRKWEFFVDGKKFAAKQPLGFRNQQTVLDGINYLTEHPSGFYLDAVRITRLPAAN